MSDALVQDAPARGLSSDSGRTFPGPHAQPASDHSASKRVWFYKSGDYKFSGHRVLINARTFKTFDALLDALSKKVPLPFGVRTITTPRGTHLVKDLDDFYDGGSYVCSDQRRVKPLNLNKFNRRQVPWNTTRPPGARRQKQPGRRNDAVNRSTRVSERVLLRTPKRLVVVKNKDPAVKRTIVLHRRTAPTFDALLDHLSQILQFPVLKLFSTDGRRVDGLAALILCSGVVVAAGNEPFRLGNYRFHTKMTQVMYVEHVETPVQQTTAGRSSRNFSLLSEQYIVNQIKASQSGSAGSDRGGSAGTEMNQCNASVRRCETGSVDNERHSCLLPQDDDIEKSFCVNQDGSMTVEMKVRLTVKEEEMLHWTTTLSRACLPNPTVCASMAESDDAVAKNSCNVDVTESVGEKHLAETAKGVCFGQEGEYKDSTSKTKSSRRRAPTPGPRHIQKRASLEREETVTESGVQESSLGHYSYVARAADGETTEGYCVIQHRDGSSDHDYQPVPELWNKRSSGVAQVLQIENNTDAVSSRGLIADSERSNEARPRSADDSAEQEMFSLSSEPICLTNEVTNNLSGVSSTKTQTATDWQVDETVKKAKTTGREKSEKASKTVRDDKNSTNSSPDKVGTAVRKKTLSSLESAKGKGTKKKTENPPLKKSALFNGHNVNTPSVRPQMKKSISDIFQPKKTNVQGKKLASKPKPTTENRTSSKKKVNLNQSVSKPSQEPTPSEIHQYVESWLEKVQVPYAEVIQGEPHSKVVFEIGGDSNSDEKNESPKLDSSLLFDEQTTGVRCFHQDVQKSAENIAPGHESPSSKSRAKIKPVLHQLCSSMRCIRKASGPSDLEKPNSHSDFSAQIASVFGSSCKAFLSFLAVMALRDALKESALEDDCDQSRSSSEAMMLLQSLLRVCAVEDKDEQWASLTHLQSRASDEFKGRWSEFQELERMPHPPEGAKTEFFVGIVSEGGDIFEDPHLSIDELMDELNMPLDLRTELTSTIQQAEGCRSAEESALAEDNKTDSEKDGDEFIPKTTSTYPDVPEQEHGDVSQESNYRDGALENPEMEVKEVEGGDVIMEDVAGTAEEAGEKDRAEDEEVVETEEEAEMIEEAEIVELEDGDKLELDKEEGVGKVEVDEETEEEKELDVVTEEMEHEEEDKEDGESIKEFEEIERDLMEESDVKEELECMNAKLKLTEESKEEGFDNNEKWGNVLKASYLQHNPETCLSHPVEISQELLDFVNSALQSSSLTFTYDARGNVRLQPDHAQTRKGVPKSRDESVYGFKCLPSPSTSDLSDYRPETSESGGYQTQDSVDIVTESGEEASGRTSLGGTNVERVMSKQSLVSSTSRSAECFSSSESGSKTPKEDLAFFSAASSFKADVEATNCTSSTPEKDRTDGVLIDRGRWLLKENHLIRRSPPASQGMYGDADTSSVDTGQEVASEDSLPRRKSQHNTLVAISSSELENMAKPRTPKCNYFNMSHGSDSDPFLDDCGGRGGGSTKGRGFRVSPSTDASRTRPNKIGSLSSFASVEFKMPDGRVHPGGESPHTVTQARRTSSGGGRLLQAQDSLENWNARCGPHCPIL